MFCKNIDCTTSLEIIGIIKAGSNTFFIKSWSFKDEEDYSDNYFKMVEESNVITLKKYNFPIYNVVSFINILTIDNTRDSTLTVAPTCKSTVKWHLTCHLEAVDTLTTSIHDDVLDIKVNRLLNQLKDTNVKSEIVIRNGDKQSQLQKDVVELSYYSKLSVCLKNLPVIRQIVGDGLEKFDQDLVMTIFDRTFENNLKESIFIFEFLSKFKSDSNKKHFSIADSPEERFKLKTLIKNEEYTGIIDYVLKKVITPQALTANFLHPSYKGNAFMKINEYSHMVYEFLIDELDGEGLQELELYQNSRGLFDKLFVKMTCPEVFWSIASEEFTKISILAESLLKTPACTFQFDQSDLGKNLPNELMPKFIDVFYSLKFMNIN